MSKIVRFHRIGGPEVLQIDTLDLPAPGSGEVRIQVKALGLNRAEAMFRSGQYLETPTPPSKLGYEAAGVVDAVGPGVTGLRTGDAVSTIPSFSQGQYGVYGDLALVPASAVAKHPTSLSWNEAAAVWMQYMTAYGALIDIAQLAAGDVALIPAASSSVGIAVLEGYPPTIEAVELMAELTALPRSAFRTIEKHAHLDPHHRDDLNAAMDALPLSEEH